MMNLLSSNCGVLTLESCSSSPFLSFCHCSLTIYSPNKNSQIDSFLNVSNSCLTYLRILQWVSITFTIQKPELPTLASEVLPILGPAYLPRVLSFFLSFCLSTCTPTAVGTEVSIFENIQTWYLLYTTTIYMQRSYSASIEF